MATIAAEPTLRTRTVPLLLAGLTACASGSVPAARPEVPIPAAAVSEERGPSIRVGLVVGAATVSVGGHDALLVNEPDGSRITTIPRGETWQVRTAGQKLVLAGHGSSHPPTFDALVLASVDPAVPVRLNGKLYRGYAEILRDAAGITVVNRLDVETYLDGVVSAEMGRRSPSERAALEAQAVVSRTYAIRNLGRRRSRGFDLFAGVSDQVYGGVAAETPEGRSAVRETRGQVLTYGGGPIEAFFYSTCGGRTADGVEVFRGGAQPYLRSITDKAENGSPYCIISPRYRWREEWNAQTLRATLERNLPTVTGTPSRYVRQVKDIRIERRTASGRVAQLAIAIDGPDIRVAGGAIRQVLRPSSGELLRSNAFTLSVTGGGERVTHLTADGTGAGHGVGFCQWGAVGRARSGHGYQQILAAYFPETRVARRY
ncbi:MAG TPA: SpoIID/LytB domain-containing protein [Gemmatimonadales bacterium]|nr:SpoIID/LytB domain-containing protein [Gemmatimonadales bacterium]